MWDLDDMQIKKASSAPVTSACTDEVGPRRHICISLSDDLSAWL